MWTQDALSCIVIRPGMAFQRPGSGERFLCVCNLRWCIIGWPFCLVTNEDSEVYYLDPHGAASIFFMHKMDDFECSSVGPALQLEEGKIAAHFDGFEASLPCCLRSFSSDLVQHELLFIADLCGHQVSKTKGRADLLQLLALQVGDQDFADRVVQADEKCKKKASAGENGEDDEREWQDDLAEMILESMDREDLSDFKDILKRVSTKEKMKKKIKWANLLEKHVQVTFLHFVFICFAVGVAVRTCASLRF
eukprot:s1285_g4.t1